MDGVFDRQFGLPKQLPGDPGSAPQPRARCVLLPGGMAPLATRSTVSLLANNEAGFSQQLGVMRHSWLPIAQRYVKVTRTDLIARGKQRQEASGGQPKGDPLR
jgi:hypothetical protein